ncbi:HSPA12A [Cordylochernes scorpioides]|uniref:HSPA12A n=1 Tax=Cordylochernes scorpioides TaxID=51811 RepID=A0ABY6K2B3_9ARAC|nr:HSPA12A [Cordylochernes scorpioides]
MELLYSRQRRTQQLPSPTHAQWLQNPPCIELATAGMGVPEGDRQVVVAIDFGSAYSGYAFCFARDPSRSVHVMRKWEGE